MCPQGGNLSHALFMTHVNNKGTGMSLDLCSLICSSLTLPRPRRESVIKINFLVSQTKHNVVGTQNNSQ